MRIYAYLAVPRAGGKPPRLVSLYLRHSAFGRWETLKLATL
nr:MAG TPA: hypothetical protein [Caudoviricetes sp.]